MSNELSRFNRVRYYLYGLPFGLKLIDTPSGWNNDEKELLRSEKYFGVMTSLSNNLMFYKDAFDCLKSAYDIFGIKANVRLEKQERNDQTDEWEVSYSGYFDFSTYSQEKNYIKIKFNESQFFKNIDSRIKEKFELERTVDLKGNPLPPLPYKNVSLQGRDIFRETLYDNTSPDNEFVYKFNYKGSSTLDATFDLAIPLTNDILKYRSDPSFFGVTNANSSNYIDLLSAKITPTGADEVLYNGINMYYLSAERNKTININVSIKIRARFSTPNSSANANFSIFSDVIRKDGNDYRSVVETKIFEVKSADGDIVENQWKEFTINYSAPINLLEGDSLGLRLRPIFVELYDRANQWQFEFIELKLLAQENDLGETTTCNALSLYQVFERLLWIITGKNSFQSDLLSGKWKDLLVTNGFKIRQFPDKKITISLEDAFESFDSIEDIALIIQDDTVRIELKSWAYEQAESIDLGQVFEITRDIAEKWHFSSIEIGYDFDGKYEEVNGLDEFNIKSTYSTTIDTIDNPFKAISKTRADAYGITLAQQMNYSDSPKTDTVYDKVNFFLDCKNVSGINYVVRHWEDDFDTMPTGIFSPDTAFNLRLSPLNCLLRKRIISTGLQKFPDDYITYSSTEGNATLKTIYAENGSIQNKDLLAPYFLPEDIKFTKKITMMQFQLIGKSPYKLIKFVNEFGEVEYGYIKSVKPNKDSKFELIKANV